MYGPDVRARGTRAAFVVYIFIRACQWPTSNILFESRDFDLRTRLVYIIRFYATIPRIVHYTIAILYIHTYVYVYVYVYIFAIFLFITFGLFTLSSSTSRSFYIYIFFLFSFSVTIFFLLFWTFDAHDPVTKYSYRINNVRGCVYVGAFGKRTHICI